MTPPAVRELTVRRGHFSVRWLVSWPGAVERGQQLGWFPTELKFKTSSDFKRTARSGPFYVIFQVLLNTLLLLILKFPIRLFYFFFHLLPPSLSPITLFYDDLCKTLTSDDHRNF